MTATLLLPPMATGGPVRWIALPMRLAANLWRRLRRPPVEYAVEPSTAKFTSSTATRSALAIASGRSWLWSWIQQATVIRQHVRAWGRAWAFSGSADSSTSLPVSWPAMMLVVETNLGR